MLNAGRQRLFAIGGKSCTRTNLSLPISTLFQGTASPTAVLARASNAGQILAPAVHRPIRIVLFRRWMFVVGLLQSPNGDNTPTRKL